MTPTMGRRLASARVLLGLRQVDVAKELGVTGAAVSTWELGLNEPSAETLAKLAEMYGVTIDYLVTGTRAA